MSDLARKLSVRKEVMRNINEKHFHKVLDLGCGRAKFPGSIGVDSNPESDADIIHDLNKFPYPFHDNEFDVIRCIDILEHLDDVVRVMEEI